MSGWVLKSGYRVEELWVFAKDDLFHAIGIETYFVGKGRCETCLVHLKCLDGGQAGRRFGQNVVAG